MSNENEVRVNASSNGRPVTMDPIREAAMPIAIRQVESTLSAGFRVHWATGENEGSKFSLSCGAGSGSPWLTFDYKDKHYAIDVYDVVGALIKFADDVPGDES